MDAGDPVISVDAKKKEHVGPFKKGGAPGRSPDDEIDQYNQWQARAAQDYLIHRPAASFTTSIITTWRK